MPGTGALNKGGKAVVDSLSCGSAGNCAAVGTYTDGSGHIQAFVASETNGAWHAAIEVPGTAALAKGRHAGVLSVSCASAGNCAAGGGYTDGSGHSQAFVASEANGTWQPAIELPGTAALNKSGLAQVNSVSCSPAGNCLAGGIYWADGIHQRAFVATERSGVWGRAFEVPGIAALDTGGYAAVTSVSCASAGNCTADGSFTDSDRQAQPFVASQTNGTWHAAIDVPGINDIDGGFIQSLSCRSPGNCVAGGAYLDGARQEHPFVASQTNDTWHAAIEVPSTAALNKGGSPRVGSVSCGSAGLTVERRGDGPAWQFARLGADRCRAGR